MKCKVLVLLSVHIILLKKIPVNITPKLVSNSINSLLKLNNDLLFKLVVYISKLENTFQYTKFNILVIDNGINEKII